MKKMIRFGLCLGLLSAALTCTALAATPDYTTDVNGTVTYYEGKYTASYANAQEGKQYALLVVKGTVENGVAKYTVNEDTIVYIDQQEATGAGVSFENWIPMSTPDCVVLLGGVFGEGVESPVVLGTLESQGVTVSGSVTTYNPGKPTTLELYVAGTKDNPVATATINATSGSGQVTQNFVLNGVPTGETYDLKITKDNHTPYWVTRIQVEEDITLSVVPALACGDIDGNGNINISDLGVITSSENYNKSTASATNSAADLNNDGNINISDLGIVTSAKNYNKGTITDEN